MLRVAMETMRFLRIMLRVAMETMRFFFIVQTCLSLKTKPLCIYRPDEQCCNVVNKKEKRKLKQKNNRQRLPLGVG